MHLSTWRWKKEKAAEMSSSISLSTVLLGVFSSPNPNQHSTPIVPTHQHQHTNEKNISLVQEKKKKKKKKKAFSRREAIGFGFSLALLDALAQANSTAIAAEEAQCALTIAPSGLAFCDRVVGTGAEATKGQLIKAHYVGMLENGKVFDSSYSRGEPLTFRVGVGEVIKGWDQGILGGEGVPPMLAGGKRTLKLPPQLGYGMRGAGCKGGSCIIPPDSVLLFDVEFIGKA